MSFSGKITNSGNSHLSSNTGSIGMRMKSEKMSKRVKVRIKQWKGHHCSGRSTSCKSEEGSFVWGEAVSQKEKTFFLKPQIIKICTSRLKFEIIVVMMTQHDMRSDALTGFQWNNNNDSRIHRFTNHCLTCETQQAFRSGSKISDDASTRMRWSDFAPVTWLLQRQTADLDSPLSFVTPSHASWEHLGSFCSGNWMVGKSNMSFNFLCFKQTRLMTRGVAATRKFAVCNFQVFFFSFRSEPKQFQIVSQFLDQHLQCEFSLDKSLHAFNTHHRVCEWVAVPQSSVKGESRVISTHARRCLSMQSLSLKFVRNSVPTVYWTHQLHIYWYLYMVIY